MVNPIKEKVVTEIANAIKNATNRLIANVMVSRRVFWMLNNVIVHTAVLLCSLRLVEINMAEVQPITIFKTFIQFIFGIKIPHCLYSLQLVWAAGQKEYRLRSEILSGNFVNAFQINNICIA